MQYHFAIATFVTIAGQLVTGQVPNVAVSSLTNVCVLPRQPGTSCQGQRGVVIAYYYNTAVRRCDMMVYGGCGGNENR